MMSLLVAGTFWCLMWYGLGRKHGFEEGIEYAKSKQEAKL